MTTKPATTTTSERQALHDRFVEEANPERPWLNHFCLCLSYFTSLVALNLGILEVFGFFYLKMTLVENILSFYLILFCLLVILTETNLFDLAHESKILRLWALRGLFYAFLGLLGLNAIDSAVTLHGAEISRGIFRNLLVIFSALMIGVGLLYVALGLLCVQVLNAKMEHKYQERKEHAEEIKATVTEYGALSEKEPLSDPMA